VQPVVADRKRAAIRVLGDSGCEVVAADVARDLIRNVELTGLEDMSRLGKNLSVTAPQSLTRGDEFTFVTVIDERKSVEACLGVSGLWRTLTSIGSPRRSSLSLGVDDRVVSVRECHSSD
jgi:hypothetical protein